jgi:hypothetical protein
MSEEAKIEVDEELKSDTNPHGIIKATATCWKADKMTGEWFPVVGEAYWEEYAPIEDEYVYDGTGRKIKTGDKTLKRNWRERPRGQIIKCAEALALRRGWPEEVGAIYEESEMERPMLEESSATEILEARERELRMVKAGGRDSLVVTFDRDRGMEMVPAGQFVDRVTEHMLKFRDPRELEEWWAFHKATLRLFWAANKTDALGLKEQYEKIVSSLSAPKSIEVELNDGIPGLSGQPEQRAMIVNK